MKNTFKHKHFAFTLIEVLLVMAIIGVLLAIAVPNLDKAAENAKDIKSATYAQSVYDAAANYDASHYNSTHFDSNGASVLNYVFTSDNISPLLDPEIEIVTRTPSSTTEFRVSVYRNTTQDIYVVETLDSSGKVTKFTF